MLTPNPISKFTIYNSSKNHFLLVCFTWTVIFLSNNQTQLWKYCRCAHQHLWNVKKCHESKIPIGRLLESIYLLAIWTLDKPLTEKDGIIIDIKEKKESKRKSRLFSNPKTWEIWLDNNCSLPADMINGQSWSLKHPLQNVVCKYYGISNIYAHFSWKFTMGKKI